MTELQRGLLSPSHLVGPAACVLLLTAALGPIARAALAQDVAPLPPVCTPLQEGVWKQIATHQLGLASRDATADRRYIGPIANFKKGAGFRRGQLGGRNWFPVDVVKRTLCGHLERFEMFHTKFTDHEADFHQFIKAFDAYGYLSSDVEPIATKPRKTYGEITLPAAIWDNPPWFTLPREHTGIGGAVVKDRDLDGSPVCIYGPWVFEDFHGNQPEIHPAQQMWWRVHEKDEIRWLVAQDVSNRFHREIYYCDVAGEATEENCDRTRPSDFVAWAPPSLSGEALVAYDLDAKAPESRHLTVFLEKSDKPGPGGPTVQDTRRFPVPGGLSELTVVHPPNADPAARPAPNATELSAAFQTKDECVTASRDRILGYVTVRVVLNRDRAQDGFAQVGVRGRPRRTDWPGPGGSVSPATSPLIEIPENALLYRDGQLFVKWQPPGETSSSVLRLTTSVGEAQISRSGTVFELPLLGTPDPLTAKLDDQEFRFPKVRLEANFKSFYRRRPQDNSIRTDLRVTYGSTRDMGGEQLAERLNGRLVNNGWTTAAQVHQLNEDFYSVFGNRESGGRCFRVELSAVVTPEGGADLVVPAEQGNCTGPVPTGGPAVRVCAMDQDQGCHWFLNDEIVDVQVRARNEFRGLVRLNATVTDPFGTSSAQTARRISFPMGQQSTLDRLIADAAATAGLQSEAELRRLGDLARSGPGSAYDELDLGTGLCGARHRRARLIILFAKYVAFDGGGDADYNRLQALATQLRNTPDDDDACRNALPGRSGAR